MKSKRLMIGASLILLLMGCGHKEIRPDLESSETPVKAPAVAQQVLDLEMTHFAFNSAKLTEKGKEVLKEDAQGLVKNPQIKIQAQGYCDDRGSVKYNLALGERRARAVKAYLETLGIAADRITTASFGKARPIDPRQTEQAWALNRRASFVVGTQQKEVAYR